MPELDWPSYALREVRVADGNIDRSGGVTQGAQAISSEQLDLQVTATQHERVARCDDGVKHQVDVDGGIEYRALHGDVTAGLVGERHRCDDGASGTRRGCEDRGDSRRQILRETGSLNCD